MMMMSAPCSARAKIMRVLMLMFIVTFTLVLLSEKGDAVEETEYVRHSNNWAVVVCTSRFWFNYRHVANALSMYHSVKRLGIPDSQIILMLADAMPCNPRNCYPGEVFNDRSKSINLYGEDVEVDYRGTEVSVENFVRVLTGRHEPGTPASRRLDTDEHSNIFIFMTGHGGDEFLKFQDFEEISSPDIADAIEEMHVKKRYNELLYIVDTCQAGTLANSLKSPNVVTGGSSKKGENSYAAGVDFEIGLSLIDRFTSSTLDFLERTKVGTASGKTSLKELFDHFDPEYLYSTPVFRTNLLRRDVAHVPLTDFLGSILQVQLIRDNYPLEGVTARANDKLPTSNQFSQLQNDREVSNIIADYEEEVRLGKAQFTSKFVITVLVSLFLAITLGNAGLFDK